MAAGSLALYLFAVVVSAKIGFAGFATQSTRHPAVHSDAPTGEISIVDLGLATYTVHLGHRISHVVQTECIDFSFISSTLSLRLTCPCSKLHDTAQVCLCCRPGRYFFNPQSTRSRRNIFLTLLLLMSGIEPNPGPTCNQFTFGLVNSRSIVNKTALLHDLISDHQLDMLAVTETWVYENSPEVIKREAAPGGYSIVHRHRCGAGGGVGGGATHGGGVALIYHNRFHIKVIPTDHLTLSTFELLLVKVTNSVRNLAIAVIYRPPSSSLPSFFSELSDLLESGALGNRFIVCGDLNCPGPSGTRGLINADLSELIDGFSLTQHVHGATCSSGNLLDHILTSDDTVSVSGVVIEDSHLSDHSLVMCRVAAAMNQSPVIKSTYRDWKRLDLDLFRQRVQSSTVTFNPAQSVEAFASQLERDITMILDELSPIRSSARRAGKPDSRWLSPEAVVAKKERRKMERRWKKTGLDSVRVAYRAACRVANRLITDSRRAFYRHRVNESSRDPRALWKVVKGLLHTGSKPMAIQAGLGNTFASHFINKIAKVKSAICAAKALRTSSTTNVLPAAVAPPLFTLTPTTLTEVSKVIARLPNKTSPLDYLHISILKSCADVIAPLIVHLVNLSFTEGRFPDSFKLSQVTPLIKKEGLDAQDPVNYRPISNLSTMSKVLERLCLSRVLPHAVSSGNFNPLQSAYRKFHNTETALLKILDDLHRIVDDRHAAVLIGLDLSAAFDTIDHHTLTDRLRTDFGLSGMALQWFESYLQDRSQYVKIGEDCSTTSVCSTGVPQGSVLGPFLFSAYVAPVGRVISSYGIQYHQYADDTQLYATIKAGDTSSLKNLEDCTAAVLDWFSDNGMQLNPEKSEVLLVATRQQAEKFSGKSEVKVAGMNVTYSLNLKSLGVTLDQSLSFDPHVHNLVKSCNYHIMALQHIRPLLDRNVANMIACSIVSSRLDYCNSLLYGTSDKNLKKLQRVQNRLARVVACTPTRIHIHPVLAELHWLPVAQRVQYKVALITHKVLSNKQPQYLADIITEYKPSRQLRSADKCLLATRKTRTVGGSRAFSCAAPAIWKTLPIGLRIETNTLTFKARLKTHLFSLAFCL